jgi:hypothetical protein
LNSIGIERIAQVVSVMRNSSLGNYIVPGLTSHLVGGGDFGKVRLFEASRDTRDVITPHSHRFNFACLVLRGSATNTIYEVATSAGEPWVLSTIDQVCGKDGLLDFVHTRETHVTYFRRVTNTYEPGAVYWMNYDDIHSIVFSANAQVLFFEGPQQVTRSSMIEPWVNGKVVPTFETKDWMFEKLP